MALWYRTLASGGLEVALGALRPEQFARESSGDLFFYFSPDDAASTPKSTSQLVCCCVGRSLVCTRVQRCRTVHAMNERVYLPEIHGEHHRLIHSGTKKCGVRMNEQFCSLSPYRWKYLW